MTFILLIGLICGAGIWTLTEATNLSGPNVCSRKVRSTEYVNRNVSYPCLVRKWFPRNQCGYRYVGNGGCYKKVRSTCWTIERYCETTWKDVHYCCDGYEENGSGGCQKSIMCEKNNGGCEQKCVTQGSDMKCDCYEGYYMDTRLTCMDIDECAINNGGCEQSCINTEGSYYCACERGYSLENHTKCKEIDECKMANGMCEHECHNVPGAHYCTCFPGFKLVEGFMCEDINECAEMNKCEICENTFGGYNCLCLEGRVLQKDNVTCKDIVRPVATTDLFGVTQTPGATERLIAPSSAECERVPVGPIVGGIIGGILLLGLIALLLFILFKRGCFDSVLTPVQKKVPSAPPVENEYDNLEEIRKIKAFSNETYAATEGVVVGGKVAPPEGHYDNTQADPIPLKPDLSVYDNLA